MRVELNAPGSRDVGHIQHDDCRDAQLQNLGCEEKVALGVGGIHHANNHVRLGSVLTPSQQHIAQNFFVRRVGVQAVGARQIDEPMALAMLVEKRAFLALDGDARVIRHFLAHPCQRVENGGFAAVRIARQSKNAPGFGSLNRGTHEENRSPEPGRRLSAGNPEKRGNWLQTDVFWRISTEFLRLSRLNEDLARLLLADGEQRTADADLDGIAKRGDAQNLDGGPGPQTQFGKSEAIWRVWRIFQNFRGRAGLEIAE